jgi:enoyl-CoA hydratase/carnithine racemase
VNKLTYKTIQYEQREHTVCITLDRPESLNAINDEMVRELRDAYACVETSESVWTLIMTGNGRALCVGADVNKASADEDEAWAPGIDTQGEPILSSFRQWDPPQEATPPYLQMTKPVICAVNGMAAGAGLDLVTTADIVIASEAATFFDPHVSIGLVSGREMVRMARVLPVGIAMRMALMGKQERMTAERAYELALVSEVVPPDALLERAWELAGMLNRNAPLAVRGTRLAIRKGLSLPVYEAELLAEGYRLRVSQTEDAQEGPRAFLEKRDPRWRVR